MADAAAPAQAAMDAVTAGGGAVAARIRAYDWSRHPLGPPHQWPQSLRTMVRVMLASRFAMWLGWGPEYFFFYNDAYAPALGLKEPRALGAAAKDLWTEIWDAVGPRADSVVQSGVATWDEALELIVERNGYPEEAYFTFSYSPVPNDAAAIGGMLCVMTEETERVIGERRLAFLHELAARLADSNTEAEVLQAVTASSAARARDLPFLLLYLYDAEGVARLAATHGPRAGSALAPEAMVRDATEAPWPMPPAASASGLVVAPVRDAGLQALVAAPSRRAPSEAVVAPIPGQGGALSPGFLVLGVNPYRPIDAAYTGFVNLLAGQIAAGISGARAYEAERRRAEALAEIDRAKTTFFSNVSHELRTPLTLMLGPIDEIANQPVAKSADPAGSLQRDRELAAIAQRSGLRLLKLVNTLLDFSRMEAGRMQAWYQPTDLAGFTAEIASTFRSAVEKAGLDFNVDCPPLPEPVHVDRDLWEKVVLNLLSNAFKYTLQGGIRVTVRATGRTAVLEVRDTGTGIPDEAKPHLFERFYRVPGAQGRSQEGTGIGLALVQELVKMHGGTIGVESELGQGTAFTVRVPLGVGHLPKPPQGDASQVSTAHGSKPFLEEAARWIDESPIAPMPEARVVDSNGGDRRSRVLVVDDNADMREYVTRLLGDRFTVVTAANGAAAVELMQAGAPDLVLSDIMMPGLDGFGLLRAIRARPEWRTLPVVLLSARAGEEARVEGIDAGADDYLTKPFSARELLARVRTHLELARVRREAADQIRASEEALRDARDRLDATLHAAEIGTWTWDIVRDRVVADRNMLRLFGMESPGEGAPAEAFFAGIHPEDVPQTRAALAAGMSTPNGEFECDYRVPQRDGSARWVVGRGRFQHDADGRPVRMSGVLIDITERKLAEQILRRSEARITAIIDRAPVGIYVLDDKLKLVQVNPKAQPIFGDAGPLVGGDFDAMIHRMWPQETADDIMRQFRHTLASGESFFAPGFSEERSDRNQKEFYDWEIHRVTAPDGTHGVVCYFIDISPYVAAQRRIREGADQLTLAMSAAKLGHWAWSAETDLFTLAPRAADILGLEDARPVTRRRLAARLNADDAAQADQAVTDAIRRRGDCEIECRVRGQAGDERWVAAKGRATFDDDGRITGMLGVVQDITAERRADEEKRALLAAEQSAREEAVALNEAARLFATDLDLQATVQRATDAATRLTGAQFGAFFYNVVNERQESYVLYSLAGAPREAFEKFGLPRNTAVFGPTFRGEGVVRVADITRDPRYGKNAPHRGMPQGHLPVRSYLAVPVFSRDGAVLGGMFFGHPEPGVFTERAERIAVGIAAQAAIAMDNAKLYEAIQKSAARLNFSLSAMNLGMWNWNPASDAVTVSERTAEIFGCTRDAKLTRTQLRELLHPDDRERARLVAAEAFSTRSDYDIEYRVNHPARGLRWVAAKGRWVQSDEKGAPAMMGVVQDITERKLSELQVRTQKEALEQIVRGVPLAVMLETLTRGVESIVDRKLMATILLREPDQQELRPVAGKSIAEAWSRSIDPLPIGDGIGSCGTAAFRRERVIVSDITRDPLWANYRDLAAEYELKACWSTPILSADGDVLGTFALYYNEPAMPTTQELEIVDVATRTAAIAIERKQSEQALRDYQAQLEEHARLLEERVTERTARLRETIGELEAFSYSVSHDMRAPLRAMQGYADAVLKDHGPTLHPAVVHALTRIEKNAERLELLVRDILAYSKVAKEEIELRPVDLDFLVPSLISQMPNLQPPSADVRIQGRLGEVLAHEAYLSQIVTNLLGNAVKFVAPGVKPVVEVGAESAGADVRISIRDNGIGIAPEHFDRIFQIFGRVYSDKQFDGTGIGLSIVKKAVQRIGGVIGVESEPGKGSCFWFTLKKHE